MAQQSISSKQSACAHSCTSSASCVFVRIPFVFYRVRQPQPFASVQRNTVEAAVGLHYVADAVQVQAGGFQPQSAQNQRIAAQFRFRAVMRRLVEHLPLRRVRIFLPTAAPEKNQSPLAAAVGVMLQGGEGRVLLRHPFTSQVTPSGRFSSSTVSS